MISISTLLALVLVTCALPPEHRYEISVEPGFGVALSRSFVVPINASTRLADELQDGANATFDELVLDLGSRGIAVETLSLLEYRRWVARVSHEMNRRTAAPSPDPAGSGESTGNAQIAALLSDLDPEVGVLIAPNLIVRSADLAGAGRVMWDGVRRAQRGPAGFSWSGNTSAASVSIKIYNRRGQRIFEGVGGLDLLFRPNVRKRRNEFVEDWYADEQHLREGICVAFYPFFGSDVTCK